MCPGRVRSTLRKRDGLDINKLNTGEKVIGVSGVLLLIFSSSPGWASRVGVSRPPSSAWTFTLCWLAVVLGGHSWPATSSPRRPVTTCRRSGTSGGRRHPARGGDRGLPLHPDQGDRGAEHGGVDISATACQRTARSAFSPGLLVLIGSVAGAYLNAKETGDLPGSLAKSSGWHRAAPPPGPPTV